MGLWGKLLRLLGTMSSNEAPMSLILVNANPKDMATVESLLDHYEPLEVQFDQMREGLARSH